MMAKYPPSGECERNGLYLYGVREGGDVRPGALPAGTNPTRASLLKAALLDLKSTTNTFALPA